MNPLSQKDASTVFKTVSPKTGTLKKYIKLYYIHSASQPDYEKSIDDYPNYTSTLNIYYHSKLTWNDYSRTHSYSPKGEKLQLFVGKINKSRTIHMKGPFYKIGIVFHPLGLNHFIKGPIVFLVKDHFSFFNYFGAPFETIIDQLEGIQDLEEIGNLLDNFFREQFEGFDEGRLKTAVQKILKNDVSKNVNSLAKEIGISRKTLLRLFKKHLGYTVEEYISVVKFRKALIHYHEGNTKRLTDIAYKSDYYDSADFSKQLKLKTGKSPRQLFNDLEEIESGLYWQVS